MNQRAGGGQAAERLAHLERYVRQSAASGRWLILTHDNPDPDALAAALVVSTLLRELFGRRATTAYGGIIGRAENQEMVRRLDLRLSQVRHLSWSRYRHFVLVDTQPGTGNNQLPEELLPDVVFDHHPIRRRGELARIQDVRPQYGATATIAMEYLLASGHRVSSRLATAVVYAIRTETRDFGREAAGPDREVYDRLLPSVDKRALARIQYPLLPLSYFQTLHRALEHLEGHANLVLCHLPVVDQPDMVPEIADLLLRLEGKTWALCTGVYSERLYLSLRTSNPRADAGRLMHRLVGRHGRGGGHGTVAGGWIDVVASGGDPAALQRRVGSELARALGRDPDKLTPLPIG